jgi:hypothetical protein
MGRDLLCKLRAQITFDLHGTAALKLRGPGAKTPILMITQEKEWCLYAPEGRPPEIPEIPELPFKIPGVWAEDNPPGLAQNVPPVVVELKPGAKNSTSSPSRPRLEFKNIFDRLPK